MLLSGLSSGLESAVWAAVAICVATEDGHTGEAPGTVEEGDYDFIVVLWQKACAGIKAAD